MQRIFNTDEVLTSEEGDLSDQGVGVAEYSYFVSHRKGDAPHKAISAGWQIAWHLVTEILILEFYARVVDLQHKFVISFAELKDGVIGIVRPL